MKRNHTDHSQAEFLRVLDDFSRKHNLSITNESTQDQFLKQLDKTLREHRTNPIRLHGFRVQMMFTYVAAALGTCKLIIEEDTGIFFSGVGDLSRPDFRLLMRDGTQFFVEVKNFYEKNPPKPYVIKKPYLEKITKYADEWGLPLKFAIYWSRWHIWTLVDASRLNGASSKSELLLQTAIKYNEMNAIGDYMVGTIPPLMMRLHADLSKPRTISDIGEVPFTIGRVSLHSGNKEITDGVEKKFAWFFMLNGKWTDVQETAKTDGDQLEYMEFSTSPEELTEGQGFEIVGTMSQMISNQYLGSTSKEGEIKSFSPMRKANEFGIIIPHDYQGKALKLWQCHVQPKFDKIDEETG